MISQAALATLPRLREIDAVGRIHATGERVRAIWREAAVTHHLPIKVGGLPALANFTFELGDDSRAYLTLFTQEMLAAGFLAGSPFYPTCAHTVEDTERYAAAVDRVFAGLAATRARGSLAQDLRGPVAHTGFARLT